MINKNTFPLGIWKGLVIHRTCPKQSGSVVVDVPIMEDYHLTKGAAVCRMCGWTVPWHLFREASQELIAETREVFPEISQFDKLFIPGK